MRPAAILTDIEGTTTPVAFVHDVLFPFARTRLPALLAQRGREPAVAQAVAQTEALSGGRPALDTLLAWMDADAKVTPLKALQGLIWEEGYRNGVLKGQLYPDAAATLRRWHAAGTRLYVYSSGSEAAQRLIFGYSVAGDLAGLFSGFFDTRTGPKREAASYTAIARAVALPPESILFLSDSEAELDAAQAAGLATCQLVRAGDGTPASARHPVAGSFEEVGAEDAKP